MTIDKRLIILLALGVGAAAGAAVASKSRRYERAMSDHREHKRHVKTWENEGGNLAPTPPPSVPLVHS